MAKKSLEWLFNNINEVNLIGKLDDAVVQSLGKQVVSGYEIDEDSRYDWRKKVEDGIKIAKQVAEKKTFPWNGAANVKFPLIASASIQFAARAYPQIVNGTDIVKAEVMGQDPTGQKEARAKRVSQHMSWQCLEQMPEWEPDMDQLLHGLPVMGTYFKKTFFDPLYQRPRSIALTPLEVVVNMKHKGTLDTCRRITQELWLYKNNVIERENAGLYEKGSSDAMMNQQDEIKEQELFLEQHCWYDCDGDGYEEPYIVTVNRDSGFVCRVVANYDETTVHLDGNDKIMAIRPIEYFTKYTFIPSPDGDFYDIGFSQLLGPINEAMSTLINQLLDAGSLANSGGGFISKGLRWNGGRLTFELGEWKPVDVVGTSLKDSILPLPVQQPSSVLFQLLGLLNDTGNKLAAVSDMMSGESPSQNTPATTVLALIEQGLKVFTAIYKRVFRSMKQEFKKLYRLNSLYMNEEEYFRVLDAKNVAFRSDYGMEDLDVVPVADPSMASEAQRLARANALMQTLPVNPSPMGKAEILYQYYDAIGAKNIDILINKQELQQQMQNPPPNPEMLRLQYEIQKTKDEMNLKQAEFEANLALILAKTKLTDAQAIKAIADAEAVEPGQQIEQYKMQLAAIDSEVKNIMAVHKAHTEAENGAGTGEAQPGGTEGVAKQPNQPKSVPLIGEGQTAPAGAAPERTNLDTALGGANGPTNIAAIGQDLRNEFASGNGPQ